MPAPIVKEIKDLEEALKSAIAKKAFFQDLGMKSFSYKQKEKEYYKKEIENKIKKIKANLLDLCDSKDRLIIEKINESDKTA